MGLEDISTDYLLITALAAFFYYRRIQFLTQIQQYKHALASVPLFCCVHIINKKINTISKPMRINHRAVQFLLKMSINMQKSREY